MGTIATLRPNANVSGGGAFVLGGGGSTVWGNLSDNNDATYIYRTASGDRSYVADLGTTLLPSTSKVKRVRAAARVLFNTKPVNWSMWIGASWTALTLCPVFTRKAKNTATTTYYTPWYSPQMFAQTGPEMSSTDVNSLQMGIADRQSSAQALFRDIWVELDIIDQPTVTVSPGATTTLRPTIVWAYSDGDGDTQTHYRVKLFSSAQYSAGGFDPETSTPTWDSGEATGEVGSVKVDPPVTNGTTYKAYVKVAHEGPLGSADPYWSAWAASTAWTPSVTPCTTPTVSAAYDEPAGRVEVTVTGAAPPAATTQTLRVERSTDGETTWQPVRGWASAAFGSPYTAAVHDYETPLGVDCAYRARVLGETTGGDDVSSAWSTSTTVYPWVGAWQFKCPLEPSLNVLDVQVLADPEIQVEETISTHRPLGADKAVTVAGDLYGYDGSYTIRAHDDDTVEQVTAVRDLIRTQNVLYVSDPFGQNKYIRIVSRGLTPSGTPDYPRTVWTVGYVEVDMPAVE